MDKLRLPIIIMLSLLLSITGIQAQDQPDSVTLVGTIQSVLGCANDWAPECEATFLNYEQESNIWRGEFELPAGEYEYKVAINGSWAENYGGAADQDGPNVPLVLEEDTSVTFLYSHETHWIADSVNHIIANVPGSFQTEVGCPDFMGAGGDWAPECYRTWLQDPDGDGVYVYSTTAIPAGEYEAKVALNGSWSLNYGADGSSDGANIPFTVSEDFVQNIFEFNTDGNLLTISTDESTVGEGTPDTVITPPIPPRPLEIEQPEMVVLDGSFQADSGCSGDWTTDCEATAMALSEDEDIWRASLELPAGEYEYKVAINGTWDENYGGSADPGGPNIPLVLEEDTTVHFYYDHFTNWVADSIGDVIAVAPGSFQTELGCSESRGADGDWAPDCFRSWLQDPDGDGVYTFATESIPAGEYEVKVALNESWTTNYGLDGTPGGANIPFSVPEDGTYVLFSYNTNNNILIVNVGLEARQSVSINLRRQQAYWVTANTIAWDVDNSDDNVFTLHYSTEAGLFTDSEAGIAGGETIPLVINPDGLSEAILDKFPHLEGLQALTINDEYLEQVPDILKSQMGVLVTDSEGNIVDGSGLQIPGVLDDLYTYTGDLGVIYEDNTPTLRVWAPTAQNVRLHLFADSQPDSEAEILPMDYDPETGVWSITGEADWTLRYYLYEVTVFATSVQEIVTNLVTDPYALSLSMNSERSQIVDLNDPVLMPEGWLELNKPPLAAPEDIVIYELHVRDFSAVDSSVPEEQVGTFAAFTQQDSTGMQHLKALAEAGLTHIHLLPAFDIATINENPAERIEPNMEELAAFAPDSESQQELINAIRDEDAFNWGYDPLHYTVPEGSYSTDPDGVQRIIEFREMVQSLNNNGLRVVMDVVYNHTNASGQSANSVLDRIVPGYYHRLDANGNVERSTCCDNTATEHNMMEKLMVDSIITWATAYKVDGFRFDLMGHHMVSNMEAVRDALDTLTIEEHGIDGKSVYVYGEGWNFGEVADNARGQNATQLNIVGTGIGTFNDRVRDAARGGNPFGGQQEQGFITGLYTYPNDQTPGTETEQLERLLLFSDQIRIALAGNLRDYTFTSADGEVVSGADVLYNGSPTGYTLDPQEQIIYIAAHDNETLWDAIQYKAPTEATIAERVRMNNLGISIVGLSQGIPFFHAGDDMLRSKSLDRDSYNSGDWFNRLDFTYQTNNWGAGLPPSSSENWDIIQPLLANADLQINSDDIMQAVIHMREILQIRKSSPLFRLQTAEQIMERVHFHNTGENQIPGLIVMSIADPSDGETVLDPDHEMIVVVFNSSNATAIFSGETLGEINFVLHPVLQSSNDPVVQTANYSESDNTFNIPALTTAVFVVEAD